MSHRLFTEPVACGIACHCSHVHMPFFFFVFLESALMSFFHAIFTFITIKCKAAKKAAAPNGAGDLL